MGSSAYCLTALPNLAHGPSLEVAPRASLQAENKKMDPFCLLRRLVGHAAGKTYNLSACWPPGIHGVLQSRQMLHELYLLQNTADFKHQ